MSLAILTGASGAFDILTGSITLPLVGAWSAVLELDAEALPTGAASIVVQRDDGGEAELFVGTITSGALFEGRAEVLLSGGEASLVGGTAVTLEPRSYIDSDENVPLSLLVADIAADAGEVLAEGVEDALLATTVARWVRARGRGGRALDMLPVESWRVLADGTLWAGTETWPEATDVEGLFQQGDDGAVLVLDVAPDAASLRPGTTILGQRIRLVVYKLTATGLSAELHYAESARGVAEELRQAVAAVQPPAAYGRTHRATVAAQRADDTLDLETDSTEIGDVNAVPLRVGIPGARVILPVETEVRLAFEASTDYPAGDPRLPYAMAIEQDADADLGVARLEDTVDVGSLQFVTTTLAPSVFTVQHVLDGVPQGVPTTIALGSNATVLLSLSGVIDSASEEVFLRA
jgi:hypothetical protein